MTRRTHRASISCLVGLVALVLGASEARAQGLIPEFPIGYAVPDETGRNRLHWLGADSPYGSYIGADLSFWAFGDTYLSSPGVNGRRLSNVVANTIAIGRIVDGKFTPSYYYSGSVGRKRGFFPNPGRDHRYWPKASVVVDGKLYVFLSLIYGNPAIPPGEENNSLDCGSVIARVNNPLDPPPRWKIDYLSLHYEKFDRQANLKLGMEILPAPGAKGLIVYGMMTNDKTRSYKTVVALVSYKALQETPAGRGIDPAQVQYLAADASNANPRWRPGFGSFDGPSDDYFDTRVGCVSGFTVRWNSILAKWQVVGAFSQYAAAYPYPRNHPYTPRPTAVIFAHPTPFGPFLGSPEASDCEFYTFPELKNSRDEALCAYTVRQWQDMNDPALRTDANLLFTYTFSTRNMDQQVADLRLYQNYHVLVPNPFSGPTGTPSPCAKPPKPAPAPVPGNSPLADPFGAPGAPIPLPFPDTVRREVVRPG